MFVQRTATAEISMLPLRRQTFNAFPTYTINLLKNVILPTQKHARTVYNVQQRFSI